MPAIVVDINSARRNRLPTVWEACEHFLSTEVRDPASPVFRRGFAAVLSAFRRSETDRADDAGFLLHLAWELAVENCWEEVIELITLCRSAGVSPPGLDKAIYFYVTDDREAAREEISRAADHLARSCFSAQQPSI